MTFVQLLQFVTRALVKEGHPFRNFNKRSLHLQKRFETSARQHINFFAFFILVLLPGRGQDLSQAKTVMNIHSQRTAMMTEEELEERQKYQFFYTTRCMIKDLIFPFSTIGMGWWGEMFSYQLKFRPSLSDPSSFVQSEESSAWRLCARLISTPFFYNDFLGAIQSS